MSATSSKPNKSANKAEPRLNELKSLLLSDELEHLQQLQQQHKVFAEQTQEDIRRIEDDSRLTPERLADQLPEAVIRAIHQSEALSNSLAPTIEESIKISVTKDPKGLVDAIFPILGPAIRKAISSTLHELVQSFNQVIEQSISWKGLKWRLESIRSGKSFADVALLHSLVYSVEQVFLIHKDSGLVLAHETSAKSATQDPDLVSGMLTAIQGFVKDSFVTQASDELESLRMGDLTVWIEPGPHAVIALVIRGNAPSSLRNTLQETVEEIHARHPRELDKFSGDTIPFETSRPLLKHCLQTQYQESEKARPPLIAIAIIAAALLAAGTWATLSYLDHKRWEGAVNELATQPGFVILTYQVDEKYTLSGLRDPLAANPMDILSKHGFKTEQIEANWQPYYSLQPELSLIRARQVLKPPSSVELSITENNFLTASGEASTTWIRQSQQTSPTLFGLNGYDVGRLSNSEQISLQKLLGEINSTIFYFNSGESSLSEKDQNQVDQLAEAVHEANRLSDILGSHFSLNINGYADGLGGLEINTLLSLQRALNIRQMLIERGINSAYLQTNSNITTEVEENYKSGRRVTFEASANPAAGEQ